MRWRSQSGSTKKFCLNKEGTKRLIEGKFRNETVEFLKNNPWICTEKIDGTNIGIVWDGHKVSYQGRTERAQIPAHLMNKLIELFGGSVNEELFEQKFGETQAILFGEGYLPEKNLWLKRDAIENIAQTFGIDVVPIIKECTITEAVQFVKGKPKSTIGTASMEGLVCKPKVDVLDRMGRRLIVKIKVCDFE